MKTIKYDEKEPRQRLKGQILNTAITKEDVRTLATVVNMLISLLIFLKVYGI